MPTIGSVAVYALLLISPLISITATAQTDSLRLMDSSTHSFIHINKIIVEGNRKTRPWVILREITFSANDTILFDELTKKLEESRNHLMNIGLFNEVVLNIKNWQDNNIDVLVTVKERWYTFPVPALDLHDRNFNVWWVDHDHSLKYLQFGLRFYQQNVRGRDEDLRLVALFGYSELYQIQYSIPYITHRQDLGLKFVASYGRTRNVTYGFANNKDLIYHNVDEYQRSNFYTLINWSYKPAFNNLYLFTLSYNDNKIHDTIAVLNPDYFLNHQTRQQYFTAQVTFVRDYRDITSYPLTGSYMEISLAKLGFGLFDNVNIFSAVASYNKYMHLGKKWYASSQNKMKVSFPEIQPYNLERGLGYSNDYISGYEYYVVDGQSFAYAKLNLKNQIFKIKIKTSPNNPFLKGAKIPFALYGKVYADAGYVKDGFYFENNPLNNSLMVGGGVGLDLSLTYDTTLRFEYSINKLGEKGFFFHVNSIF